MRAVLTVLLAACSLLPSHAATRFVPVDLSAAFDNDAVATKDQPGDGNFDAIGTTQPATFNFSEEGWPKEPEAALAGVTFRLGSIAGGAKNNVIADGQDIKVPEGRYSALYVLAAATNGSYTGTWTLSFEQGTQGTASIRVSDWCAGPRPGEAVAIRSSYRYFAGGGPSPDCAPQVFVQRIDLDPARTLSSVTLPKQINTHVFALTLGEGDRITPTGLLPIPPPEEAGPRVTITSDAPRGVLVVPPGDVRLTVTPDRLSSIDVIRIGPASRSTASANGRGPGEPVEVSLKGLSSGYYPIEVRATTGERDLTLRSGLFVVPDDVKAESKPDSIFAMNEGFDQADPERARTAAYLARRAGVRWVRQGFGWSDIEPEPGRWSFEAFDGAVRTARAEKLLTMGLLAYWAGWSKPFTAEGVAAFTDYAGKVVSRYKDVPAWEVWNEPNIFYWKGTRDQYATLLTAAIGAIHDANPRARAVGIATAFSDVPFVRGVLEAGARPDVVSIHPYRGDAPDTPAKLAQFDGGKDPHTMAQETRGILRAIQETAGNVPLWFTEIGWWTSEPGGGGLTEAEQATYLARTYAIALSEGVEKVFWYAFIDAGTKPNYDQHHFGILRPDLSPKPAYAAYAIIARRLEGAVYDGSLDLGENVHALRFLRGKETVTVLWSRSGEPTVDLPVTSPGGVRVQSWDGREATTQVRNGRLSLPLTSLPVYVIDSIDRNNS